MKSYKQFCGVAKALDVVGERWTLLIVRDLILGPRRYTDLLHGLPGLTTNLLARRLEHLQHHGLVARESLPPPASSTVYVLTEAGRRLEPVIFALGAFGESWLQQPREGDRLDARYAVLSLHRRFGSSTRQRTVVLVAGDLPYTVRFGPEGLTARDGDTDVAHARVLGSPLAIARLVTGRSSIAELGDGIAVEGDPKALSALVDGLHR